MADGGFLSTNQEWHSFTIGMYASFKSLKPVAPKELPNNPDVQAEPHYFKGGFIVGSILQAGLIIALLWIGVPLL